MLRVNDKIVWRFIGGTTWTESIVNYEYKVRNVSTTEAIKTRSAHLIELTDGDGDNSHIVDIHEIEWVKQ